jgi:HEAT repeat protein
MFSMTIRLASALLAMSAFTLPHSDTSIAGVQNPGDTIVQQLRDLPPLSGIARSDGTVDPLEQRRRALYQQLRQLGNDAVTALARGLRDPDVRIRKNVALALMALAGDWFERSAPRMDIRACLPALIVALQDSDTNVRAWSAQAIGEVGSEAVQAVPALIALLMSSDEGSRNSACIALFGIGPAAKGALPALERALDDPSADVKRFARRAIEKIQG